MRLKTLAEITTGIGAFAGCLFTRAKSLADVFGIIDIPKNLGELFMKASEAPLYLVYGLFIIGLVSVAFLVYDTVIPTKQDEKRKFIRAGRMIPFIGMIVFGSGFLICAAWYFWPAEITQNWELSG